MAGLLDALKQYLSDAAPGGLLNQEWTPENVRTAGEVASMMPNPAGDIASGLLAADDLRKGNYGEAALNGLGLLPFVPAMGGVIHNKLPLDAIKKNLLDAGYEVRPQSYGQWVLPDGSGLSSNNKRGIVNHYEAAFDAGLIPEGIARSSPLESVKDLLKEGWLRWKGGLNFESHGLPDNHRKWMQESIDFDSGNPSKMIYIDDTSAGKAYSLQMSDYVDSGYDLQKALRKAKAREYQP